MHERQDCQLSSRVLSKRDSCESNDHSRNLREVLHATRDYFPAPFVIVVLLQFSTRTFVHRCDAFSWKKLEKDSSEASVNQHVIQYLERKIVGEKRAKGNVKFHPQAAADSHTMTKTKNNFTL